MAGYEDKEYKNRLAKLVHDAEQAKREHKDRWGLPPVEKGWLRGHAVGVSHRDEPCEFGTLEILEFELSDTPRGNGIPVRMAGTYFNFKLAEATVVDVPDPSPAVRPITPYQVFLSHHGRKMELQAYYPGRDMITPRRSMTQAVLVVTIPGVVLVTIIAVLHFVFHIFG